MTRRTILALAFWWSGVAPLGAAPPAASLFHTQLEESAPAAGDTLAAPPTELVLTFGGLIESSGAAVRLLGPSGATWALEASRLAGSTRTLSAPLPGLDPGGYRVEWRVISGDGHPISGDFVFWVGGGAEGAALSPPPPATPSTDGDRAHVEDAGGSAAARLMSVRAAADAASLLLAGLLLFASFGGVPAPRTTAATTGLAVVAPLLVAVYAWLWAGSVIGGDVAERLQALGALHTGRARTAEVALSVLVPWALLLARRPRIAAAFALLALTAGAFAGHAASHTPAVSIPASALHQAAAAIWLGGLLFLVTEAGTDAYAQAARRVSRAALATVAAVTLTGLVQAFMLVDSLATLTASAYGALLLAKSAGLLALVAFGAHHRFRLLPAVAAGEGGRRLAASVRWELAVAVAVVALAAILSHVPPNP